MPKRRWIRSLVPVERISLGSLRQSLRITVALSLILVLFSVGYGVPIVSMYQYTHLYITSIDHSGIGPLLVNKHRLSLKSDLTLQAPNSLSDPDRIPLTYVSVTFTDYRSAFSPTHSCCLLVAFHELFPFVYHFLKFSE